MKVALVTGGTGFVGSHLISALNARGCAIRVLALPTEDTAALEQQGVRVYRGDVCEPETLVEPMRGADTVFHLAAIHGLWRPKQVYSSVNVGGTENVCRAVLATGAQRLIHVSTWSVYGLGLGIPLHENLPLKPLSDYYTATKAEADQLVQRYIAKEHLPAVIIRPGMLFGPGDYVSFTRMAERLRTGRVVIIGSGANAVAFVYVTNVVDGLVLAATRSGAVGQIYNLPTEQPMTQEEFWRAIAEEIGAPPPRIHVPYSALYTLAFLSELALNPENPRSQPLITRLGVQLFGANNRVVGEKARRELGYAPRISMREGIRLTADWYLKSNRKHECRDPVIAT